MSGRSSLFDLRFSRILRHKECPLPCFLSLMCSNLKFQYLMNHKKGNFMEHGIDYVKSKRAGFDAHDADHNL